jgi:hypothetical protein
MDLKLLDIYFFENNSVKVIKVANIFKGEEQWYGVQKSYLGYFKIVGFGWFSSPEEVYAEYLKEIESRKSEKVHSQIVIHKLTQDIFGGV